jgi:hypothetical protein
MDDREAVLAAKLENLLKQAAEVSAALDRASGTISGVPHYSVIEGRAHDLGRQLSREIQGRQLAEIVAQAAPTAKCPECGTRCELGVDKRLLTSIDGPVGALEQEGYCPCCRRAFFPSA